MRRADSAGFIHLRPSYGLLRGLGLGLTSFALPSLFLLAAPGLPQTLAQSPDQGAEKPLNPFASGCPLLLKPLLNQVLEDFPSYINRSIQRRTPGGNSLHYLLGLSPPDYRPADLQDFSDRHPEFGLEPLLNNPSLYQVFFTSRQRRYETEKMADFQEFHWLLFEQDDRYHWHLRAMISQDEQGNVRNSTSDPIAEGIQQGLAACGSVDSDP